jgi:hypothetical protein
MFRPDDFSLNFVSQSLTFDDDDDDEFLHRFGRSPCGASASYRFGVRKTLWGIKTSSSCQ